MLRTISRNEQIRHSVGHVFISGISLQRLPVSFQPSCVKRRSRGSVRAATVELRLCVGRPRLSCPFRSRTCFMLFHRPTSASPYERTLAMLPDHVVHSFVLSAPGARASWILNPATKGCCYPRTAPPPLQGNRKESAAWPSTPSTSQSRARDSGSIRSRAGSETLAGSIFWHFPPGIDMANLERGARARLGLIASKVAP